MLSCSAAVWYWQQYYDENEVIFWVLKFLFDFFNNLSEQAKTKIGLKCKIN